MGRLITFLLFFTVFSGIMFGIHYFIFQVISKNLSLSEKVLHWMKWFFVISGFSIIAGQMLSRLLDIHFIQYYGYIWLGFISITFTVFLIATLVKIFIPSIGEAIILSAVVLSALITIYSLVNNLSGPVIREIEITTKIAVNDTGEFRIVQLSDVHIDNSKNPKVIKKLVESVNSLSPHLIVITGDLIDGHIDESNKINRIFNELDSTHGVFAVTGNHEYYSGIENFIEFAGRAGIKILSDEHLDINNKIALYGLEDKTSTSSRGKNWTAEVLGEPDKNKFNILIGHRPYGIEKNGVRGIDLQMAGHTHAGQIPPMDLLVQLIYKYPHGLYRSGNSFIYTTSGTGIWGPPMRFLSRSEIVLFKIRHGEKISGKIVK